MSTAPDPAQQAPAAVAAGEEALAPGTRFGELEILRVLGVGGFGIVYLARDHALERDVALKEYMPASLAVRGQGPQITVRSGALSETYAAGLRSFINEARLLAKFDHPSLVKVYRFWEDNATAYMVMPFLQGRTLREARRAMAAPPGEAWMRGIVEPILGALDVLHRDGVFHRDVAPDNILLPHEGPPVLLDFGAARRVIGDRTQSLTAILKPNYAPIEQYADVTTLRQGPWTDLYALGAVVHFLLTGAPPPPSTARAVQDDMQPLWTRSVAGVSQRFLRTFDWALAVRPQDRPQSVQALRDVLEGRAEAPAFAPTIPFGAPAAPAGDAATVAQHDATRIQPTGAYATTVRVEPPTSARMTGGAALPPPAVPPTDAPASAVPATSSRKGLVGAALAVVAVLAAAGGWQYLEASKQEPTAVAAATAPSAATAATPPAEPAPSAQAAAPVGSEPAPAAVADDDPSSTSTADQPLRDIGEAALAPAVAETSALAQPDEPSVPPAPTAPVTPPVTEPATGAAPARSGARPVATVTATRPAVRTEPAATDRSARPATTAAEATRAERARALRESLREQRQARAAGQADGDGASAPDDPPVVARVANLPLGAQMPGTVPLGAPVPGDTPLGAAPAGPATAREACGSRVLLALWNCMQRECRKARYAQHPECVRLDEERRARELQ